MHKYPFYWSAVCLSGEQRWGNGVIEEDAIDREGFAQDLLAWYDDTGRSLPWRAALGTKPNGYHVWLSEIMAQQTVVKAVIPYFQKFIKKWPTIQDLAKADIEQVRAQWAGLGYYRRAQNLHKTAQIIAKSYEGAFPSSEKELLTLPGVGPYTAAAIAAIVFDHPTTPVDGNIERVMSRIFKVEKPLPASKPEIKKLAVYMTPKERPGCYAQALMDLGASLCRPTSPSCLLCPVEKYCAAKQDDIAASLPRRTPRKTRPNRFGACFFVLRADGMILLHQRPEDGLLGGMMELPSTPYLDQMPSLGEAIKYAPVDAQWWPMQQTISHVFTHFKLELSLYKAIVPKATEFTLWSDAQNCSWVKMDEWEGEALPSLFKKAIRLAQLNDS